MNDEELVEKAKKAMTYAYAPYSNFKVGAALLTNTGKVYTGCNIENSSYGASNCAERTAVFNAVSNGERNFTKIAIVSSGGDFTFPCGICRQVLSEFMSGEQTVILTNDAGETRVYSIEELLPHAFRL